MGVRKIIHYPASVLRQKAEPVTDFGSALQTLIDDMVETMYAARGIGLAANQVGVTSQVLVADVGEDEPHLLALVNPEVVEAIGSTVTEEGCLSIPDYREKVKRPERVVVKAKDRFGDEITIEADGLLAVCLQHEIDHLNGVLFIDHLSRLKRELFLKWHKKQKRREKEDSSHEED